MFAPPCGSDKSEEADSAAAWGANVVMAIFAGGMIPLAFMKTLSHMSPVKWCILSPRPYHRCSGIVA